MQKDLRGTQPGKLPDPKVCRTKVHPSLFEFMHCRTPQSQCCPYVVPFGMSFFCSHPKREQFLDPPVPAESR